jgi:hypothetical protein
MPKKVQIKTSRNSASACDFLNSIEPATARKEAKTLAALFRKVTGAKARMWGASIVGYGEYTYFRANGDEGSFMASGFAIRKSGPTLYIMTGFKNKAALLGELGPHKLGKSCLYLKNLENVNLTVVETLITQSITELQESHNVRIV